jgi:hypothetical protein
VRPLASQLRNNWPQSEHRSIGCSPDRCQSSPASILIIEPCSTKQQWQRSHIRSIFRTEHPQPNHHPDCVLGPYRSFLSSLVVPVAASARQLDRLGLTIYVALKGRYETSSWSPRQSLGNDARWANSVSCLVSARCLPVGFARSDPVSGFLTRITEPAVRSQSPGNTRRTTVAIVLHTIPVMRPRGESNLEGVIELIDSRISGLS